MCFVWVEFLVWKLQAMSQTQDGKWATKLTFCRPCFVLSCLLPALMNVTVFCQFKWSSVSYKLVQACTVILYPGWATKGQNNLISKPI